MVSRDTDYADLAKWASAGDVATPESVGINRAFGWQATFSDPTTDAAPQRTVWNYQFREITAMLLDKLDFGILPYDAAQTYRVNAVCLDTDGEIYQSQAGSNTGNALTDITSWLPFRQVRQSELDDTFSVVSISAMVMTMTRVGGGTVNVTIPESGGMADGVLDSAVVDATNEIITLETDTGDEIQIDMSGLLAAFQTQTQVDARMRLRYSSAERTAVATLVFATETQAEDGTNASRYMNPRRTADAIAALGDAHIPGIASQNEAEAGTNNSDIMTPLRTRQAINDRAPDLIPDIANQSQAEQGINTSRYMSPLRTSQAIDAQGGTVPDIASQNEAEAGTNNTDIMTPLRTRQAVDDRVPDILPDIATQQEAEAGTNNIDQMTPLRTAQAIEALNEGLNQTEVDARMRVRYTDTEQTSVAALQFASESQAESGTNGSRYMNPRRTADAIAFQVGVAVRGWGATPPNSGNENDLWIYLETQSGILVATGFGRRVSGAWVVNNFG